MPADAAIAPAQLPLGAASTSGTGWWGVLCLIAAEASLFVYLLFSYYYLMVQRGLDWIAEPHPSIAISGPNTLVLIASSFAVAWGERGIRQGRRRQHVLGVGLAIALGLVFLVGQYFEWKTKPYGLTTSAYGSLFFTITGFHMAHVIVGVLVLCTVLMWSLLGHAGKPQAERVRIAALYWHFVDAVWLCVFSTFYLSPYLMGA